MLAQQGRALERQHGGGIGDRREGAVIDAPQPEGAIEPARLADDRRVIGIIRTDNHLGRLPGRGKARSRFEPLARILRLDNRGLDRVHCPFDRRRVLVWCQPGQPGHGWQFDIDRNAIGIAPRAGNQFGIGLGNGLEVDIAAKFVLFAQDARCLDQLLHRVA